MALTQTVTRDGAYTVVTFTGTGSTLWVPPAFVREVEFLVIGAGGSGGNRHGGGGGAGGVRQGKIPVSTAIRCTVVVGTGGALITGAGHGNDGTYSQFGYGTEHVTLFTGAGGGGGGCYSGVGSVNGNNGGSGGGAGNNPGNGTGGSSSPVTTPVQGYAGGDALYPSGGNQGGGGGGAGGAGQINTSSSNGGPGIYSSITGVYTGYAGGGGGGRNVSGGAATEGGGNSGNGPNDASPGVDGTGGGGGGARNDVGGNPSGTLKSGKGGDGVVILRYTLDIASIFTRYANLITGSLPVLGMDVVYQAQPFIYVPTKSNIILTTMDYVYLAQPFVSNYTPETGGPVLIASQDGTHIDLSWSV